MGGSAAWVGACVSFAAALIGWQGRAVLRAPPEARTEHWIAYQVRSTVIMTFAIVFVTVLLDASVAWLLLIVPITALLRFPVRRRIFEERWSLFGYLAFQSRVLAATASQFLLLAFLPALAFAIDGASWTTSGMLGVLIFAWMHALGRFYPRIFGATPMTVEALGEASVRVLERARCAAPDVYRVVPEGGTFANALAVPGTQTTRVLVGQSLLDVLDDRERAALMGHEVAHLEHFDPRRLKRVAAVLYAILVVAVAVGPLVAEHQPRAATSTSMLWAALVVVAWLAYAISHRRHEAESDLRALELCEDGDALVSALTKVHAVGRMPRRLAAETEDASTHPSLARRVQAIRRAMGQASIAPPAPFEPFVVRDHRDPAVALVFGSDHVHRLTRVPPDLVGDADAFLAAAGGRETLSYRDTASANVEARWKGQRFVALGRDGTRIAVELAAGDVAAVQGALDRFDVHFASKAPPSARRAVPWLLAIPITFLLLGVQEIRALGVILNLLLALMVLWRARGAFYAVAAVCLADLIVLTTWPGMPEGRDLGLMVVGLALALAALGYWARREGTAADPKAAPWPLLVPLALAATPLFLWTLIAWADALTAHLTMAGTREVIPAAVALGGALVARHTRLGRALGAVVLVAGLAGLGAGTTAFRDRMVSDPLIAEQPVIDVLTEPEPTPAYVLDGPPGEVVALSPSGHTIVVAPEHDAYDDAEPEQVAYVLHGRDRPDLTIAASSVALLDDARALVLRTGPRLDVRVSVLDRRSGEERDLLALGLLPRFAAPQLGVDAWTGRYWVVWRDGKGDALVRVQGKPGEPPQQTRLSLPRKHVPEVSAMGMTSTLLTREYRYDPKLARLGLSSLVPLFSGEPNATQAFDALGPGGLRHLFTTRMTPRCVPGDPRGARYVCLVKARRQTELWQLDTMAGGATPLGRLRGDLYDPQVHDGILVATSERYLHVVDLAARQDRRHLLPDRDCAASVAWLPEALALTLSCADATRIRLYPRDGLGAAGGVSARQASRSATAPAQRAR